MSPAEQDNLRALLVTMLTMMKANMEAIAQLTTELGAVTLAVRGLDPTFEEVLAHRREVADEASTHILRESFEQFDALILQLKRGRLI